MGRKRAHIIPIAFIANAIERVRTSQMRLRADLVISISRHVEMNALQKIKK